MPRSLKLYIAVSAITSAVALVVALVAFPPDRRIGLLPTPAGVWLGVAFWTGITLLASALPVRMPRGTLVAVSIAPVIVAMNLGGPGVAALVAAVGTTEIRELRGRIPWYGTVANHAGMVLPTLCGSLISEWLGRSASNQALDFLSTLIGATVIFVANVAFTAFLVALRTGQDARTVLLGDAKGFATSLIALAPLGWLMAQVYAIAGGWWATLLFALPLYTTRVAYHQFVEMREMFTQTVDALSGAVDKRDPYTA
ncbi:MAG TPA: hypothetical protein VF960_00475, partial [Chloroflexota bacterium]